MADPKLNARLGLDTKEFDRGLKKAEGQIASFGKGLITAAAVMQVVRMGSEMVKLAAKAEGIKTAFDKLNNPGLLQNLQKATRNTIADVDLMSAAVRASNFHIALKELPKYFEFAAQRARATGESVDYLVDSIINGIGRRSTLVLDNLGISATELNAQLKLTPDYAEAVGIIISKSIGDAAETSADQIDQLSASWKNLSGVIGDMILRSGLTDWLAEVALQLRIMSDTNLTQWQKFTMSGNHGAGYKQYQNSLAKYNSATGYNPVAGMGASMGLGGFNMTAGLSAAGGGTSAGGGGGAPAWAGGKMSSLWNGNISESGINTSAGSVVSSLSQINSLQLSVMEGAKGVTRVLMDQVAVGNMLTSVFTNVFSVMDEGWAGMAAALIDSLKQIAREIAAKAAAWAVLTLITGGTFSMASLGSFLGLTSSAGQGGLNSGLASGVSGPGGGMQLSTVVSGRDLKFVLDNTNNMQGRTR